MTQQSQPTLLSIGVAGLRPEKSVLDLYTASTLREAIATIRLVSFDLILVGLDNPALDVWELMHRFQSAWPDQNWIFASDRITNDQEVYARSFGALLVLHEVPDEIWLADFAASLRRRNLSKSLPKLSSVTASALPTKGVVVQAEAL